MKNITFFQAANLTDSEVISQFVVRKKELEQLLSEIRNDDMSSSIQHYILVGHRGSGKSTLLRRIQAEINTDNKLQTRLVAVNLSEEQAGIYRLHDLWERVCEELRIKDIPVKEVHWEEFSDNLTAYAKAQYEAMQHALKKVGKKLVLLLDNIDRILENIKTDDNHLLRELLMNHKDVRIIGGSTRMSEHHWKYDQPFYQFFQIIRLAALTEDEMKELLVFWADFIHEPALKEFAEKHTGKLNAVRVLSDGMPRTMLSLVDLLINKPDRHGYEYLRFIIDRATPIYQERLAMLSPLHQKVVLELSFFWNAVKIKELSAAAKIESKTLSAALKQLVDLQIVEKRAGSNKNMLYLLQERFFNLWLIMTQGGPKQKSRVKWLTIFLETWYEPNELKEIYSRYTTDQKGGKLQPNHAIVMTKALVHSSLISVDERDDLLETIMWLISNHEEYAALLSENERQILIKAIGLFKENKFDKALRLLEEIGQEGDLDVYEKNLVFERKAVYRRSEKQHLSLLGKDNSHVFLEFANLNYEMNQKEKAEQYYLKAIEKGDVDALYNLAVFFYAENKNPAEALSLFEKFKLLTKKVDLGKQMFCVIANIWAGNPEVLDQSENLIEEAISDNEVELLKGYLVDLLIHHQTNTVWHYFQHKEYGETLRDMLKPIYFAAAHFIQNDSAKELLLTQPPELDETIAQIVAHVNEKRAFYYAKHQ